MYRIILLLITVIIQIPICFSQHTIITPVDGSTSSARYAVCYEWRATGAYSLYQHIYKQSLINYSGRIEKIELEHTGTSGSITNMKIYMGETSKSSFSSTGDWVNSGLTLVYDGTITTSSGWNTITLTTPFNYTNSNNLILVFHQHNGTTVNNSSAVHVYGAADPNVTLYNYAGSTLGSYGSWSSSGFSTQGILPSLKLHFKDECVINTHPAGITVCPDCKGYMNAGATGNNLSFRWQEFNGTSWSDIISGSSYSVMSSTTTSTLAVNYPIPGMNGYQYRCISLTSGTECDTSNLATLTVSAAVCPAITETMTFSYSTVHSQGSWDGSLTIPVTVNCVPAGYKLIQVNIHMGRQADAQRNFSYYNANLISPEGDVITVISGATDAEKMFPNSGVTREFNSKFRDNQYLMYPRNGSGSLAEPWHIGYYRTRNANAFAVCDGDDHNGIWNLLITENHASDNGARLNSVELVFGNLNVTDYTSYGNNDQCATPFCLRTEEVAIGSNNGFTSQASDMYNPNTTGCSWNMAQNNSSWFMFKASATTAIITISGITDQLQILGIASSGGQCTASNNTVLNGGCPTAAVNDTYLSSRYSNGSIDNNQLNMSGLTVGQTYYFIVDGTGGAISPFYIEITGADNGCTDVLPVSFKDVSAKCSGSNLWVIWNTESELNNDFFTVQVSDNGLTFRDAAIADGAGTTNSPKVYQEIIPVDDSGTNLYVRIRQTDFDGQGSFSETISVKCSDDEKETLIHPTIFSEYLSIKINGENAETTFKLFDMSGRIVLSGVAAPGENKINTEALAKGSYLIRIDGSVKTKLIFKD